MFNDVLSPKGKYGEHRNLGWRVGNENHLNSEGSNAHPVVMEDITVVYSRYRGVHFSSETVMMLLRQRSHAIKTLGKERNARSQKVWGRGVTMMKVKYFKVCDESMVPLQFPRFLHKVGDNRRSLIRRISRSSGLEPCLNIKIINVL